jgi:hypothetical protein
VIGHWAQGGDRPWQGALGGVLADPVLAGVHQRGELGQVRVALEIDGGTWSDHGPVAAGTTAPVQ